MVAFAASGGVAFPPPFAFDCQDIRDNKERAFSQKLFLYRFSIGINFFKVKKIVLGY